MLKYPLKIYTKLITLALRSALVFLALSKKVSTPLISTLTEIAVYDIKPRVTY